MWLGGVELISKLILFIATVWVVRFYGPTDFGKLNLANATAAMILFAADFGISTILTREIARFRDNAGTLYVNAFFLKIVTSLFLFLLYTMAIFWYPATHGNMALYLFAGVFVILQSFEGLQIAFLLAFETMERVFAVRITHYIGIVISAFLVVSFHLSLEWLLLFYSMSSLLSIFISFFFIRDLRGSDKAHLDTRLMKSLLLSSLPIFGAMAVSQLYLNTDTVLIGHFFGATQVGLYQSAYKILFAFQAINLINTVTFPRITVLVHEKNQKTFKKLVTMIVCISLLILVPLALVIGWKSELIVRLIYGTKYLPASPIMAMLIWAGVVNYFRIFTSNLLIAQGKQNQVFGAVSLGLLINVSLNYFIMPRMGYAFSAGSLMISELFILCIMVWKAVNLQRV